MSFDYVRQTRINSKLVYYDVENCYDCVAQKFTSLTNKDFYMPFPEKTLFESNTRNDILYKNLFWVLQIILI